MTNAFAPLWRAPLGSDRPPRWGIGNNGLVQGFVAKTDTPGISDDDRMMVLAWKTSFDDYNNGDIGPGHCDETEYEEIDGISISVGL